VAQPECATVPPAVGRRNACDDARPGWGTPASVHGEVGKATNGQGRYPMGVANMDKEEEIDVAGGRLKTRDRITRIEFLQNSTNSPKLVHFFDNGPVFE